MPHWIQKGLRSAFLEKNVFVIRAYQKLWADLLRGKEKW
jgi:hypothetical protein